MGVGFSCGEKIFQADNYQFVRFFDGIYDDSFVLLYSKYRLISLIKVIN
jgi:hypothetical protein